MIPVDKHISHFKLKASIWDHTQLEGEGEALLRFAVCDCLCIIECSAFDTITV